MNPRARVRVCDKNLALEELGDEFVQEFDRSLEVDYWYALENPHPPPDGHVIDPRVEEQLRKLKRIKRKFEEEK